MSIQADVDCSDANKEIQKGDEIFAVGNAARINDRPVVFARYYGELVEMESIAKTQWCGGFPV